jgi:AcrR family transcriptional regulator
MPPSRRDDLIEAAMRVFYRNGFHASGLDKILREGGISRMTLYNHFKSKDELIVAALRRRDEIFRNKMMKFIESKSDDPIERLLAVFDFHEQFCMNKDFCGCMFINASAEYADPNSPVRRVTADHKRDVIAYLQSLCEEAAIEEPEQVAEQLSLLIEGAIVSSHVVDQVRQNGADAAAPVRLARKMAKRIIDSSMTAHDARNLVR